MTGLTVVGMWVTINASVLYWYYKSGKNAATIRMLYALWKSWNGPGIGCMLKELGEYLKHAFISSVRGLLTFLPWSGPMAHTIPTCIKS